jgi:hypothetical protein
MINKNWIIIALAVIVAALIGGFWYYDHAKLKKQSAEWKTLYRTCQNAPADTVVIHDSIMIPGVTIIKPIPVSVIIRDTIIRQIAQNWYDSVYKGDGWRFRYKAKVTGSLDYIEFIDLVAPVTTTYITRHIDTCLVKPLPKQPLLRIGPYAGVTLNSFSRFPGFELGGQMVIKDQATLSVGGQYLDGFYANVRLGILFK